MNPFFNLMNNPMLNVLRQVQQIKQNPNQLAVLLRQRGMINDRQAQDISKMGSNYEEVGHYLITQGRMPTDVRQYENQVNEVQNMMQNSKNT